MTTCRDPRVDRLQYVEGARLLAGDLHDSRSAEARWQSLHVRGLHDTWGVANGLGLTLTPDRRGILVAPGAAFDCRGDVVRLAAPVELPMPAYSVPGVLEPAFDVVLSANGVRWEPTGGNAANPAFGPDVHHGVDIPLGRCVRLFWGVLTAPDSGVRRSAHPTTRPRIGFTRAGGLTWMLGTYSLRAIVDTSAAGFLSTPFYTAELIVTFDLGGLIGPFLSLSSFYPDHFTARLFAISPAGFSTSVVLTDLLSRAGAIQLAWVGIEPNAGCSGGAPGGFV